MQAKQGMLMMLLILGAVNSEELCDGATCTDPAKQSAQADAMLQVHTKPHSFRNVVTEGVDNSTASKPHCSASLVDVDETEMIEEARTCLPKGLMSQHLAGKEKKMKADLAGKADSLPLRDGDVIRIKSTHASHGKCAIGFFGSAGAHFTAAPGCEGAKHGVFCYKDNTLERTKLKVAISGDIVYFTQTNHGSFMGMCGTATPTDAWGCDGTESSNVYSFAQDAKTGWKQVVDPMDSSNIYLQHLDSSKWLGVACDGSNAEGNHHKLFGYLDQYGTGSNPAPRALEVEFISRTTTTTTTASRGLTAKFYYYGAYEVSAAGAAAAAPSNRSPDITRIDATVNYANVASMDVAQEKDFAASWTGAIRISEAGVYTFSITSDDGSILNIDNEKLIDNDGIHGPEEKTNTVSLSAGDHKIELLFIQEARGAEIALKYSGPDTGDSKVVVPQSVLSPTVPVPTTPPPTTTMPAPTTTTSTMPESFPAPSPESGPAPSDLGPAPSPESGPAPSPESGPAPSPESGPAPSPESGPSPSAESGSTSDSGPAPSPESTPDSGPAPSAESTAPEPSSSSAPAPSSDGAGEGGAEVVVPAPAPESTGSGATGGACSMVLVKDAKAGDTSIEVSSQECFYVGQELVIAKGLPQEEAIVIAGFGTIILRDPLTKDHAAGSVMELNGSNAPLTAAGFKAVTALCCPPEMETFFLRILSDMNLQACSMPHIQGLMHWFSCVPDMDYQYLIDVINNGNPCKFWGKTDEACPPLSEACTGKWCR